MPEQQSFLTITGDNVVLTAVKKAEDSDALILRYYEWAGKESDVQLHPSAEITSAEETDLMERPLHPLSVTKGEVAVHTKPFEIKTLRVQLAAAAGSQAKADPKP